MSSQELTAGLKVRHLTMMGLGSAIGAGLFVGTGKAISTAGPAVLISYLLAGAMVIIVMMLLAEIARRDYGRGRLDRVDQGFSHRQAFATHGRGRDDLGLGAAAGRQAARQKGGGGKGGEQGRWRLHRGVLM